MDEPSGGGGSQAAIRLAGRLGSHLQQQHVRVLAVVLHGSQAHYDGGGHALQHIQQHLCHVTPRALHQLLLRACPSGILGQRAVAQQVGPADEERGGGAGGGL